MVLFKRLVMAVALVAALGASAAAAAGTFSPQTAGAKPTSARV